MHDHSAELCMLSAPSSALRLRLTCLRTVSMNTRLLNHTAMDASITELSMQVHRVRFTPLNSRKRPFSAVSQLQSHSSRIGVHTHRHAGNSIRIGGRLCDQPRSLVTAQAASLDTEDLAHTPVGSDKARPKTEPDPQQQQPRFDWHAQWYAIGYEK